MENNIIDAEKDLRIKALERALEESQNDVTKLKIMLKELGADVEHTSISDEEAIAVQQISRLKKESDQRELSAEEVKNFDLLHKNLRLARSGRSKMKIKEQTEGMSTEELNKILG